MTIEIMFKFLTLIFSLFLASGYATLFRNPFNDPAVEFGQKVEAEVEKGELENTKRIAETAFNGKWELVSNNSGVSAMHAILLPKVNKVLMYDATVWKISTIQLPQEKMPCRIVDVRTNEHDCWAHSVLYDVETASLKALKIQTDTWCSSGGLTVDGHLVSTGGYQGGANTVRYLWTCDTCDWKEYPTALAERRWYSTQVTLPDGNFIVVGGRGAFSYEYIPPEGQSNKESIFLPLLQQTHDQMMGNFGMVNFFTIENNLYPFVHLSTDGNLFIFSNNRSILFDPKGNKVVHEFPVLPGGSRNYPASGMSVLLPIKLHAEHSARSLINAEVLVCGGAVWDAFFYAEVPKQFVPALQDCGRIKITNPKAVWKKEIMPSRRVMGDMTILPTGDVLLINGAQNGTSAWNDAEVPNLAPALYKTKAKWHHRFKELAATTIPRMYHSVSVLLPDGKVLVGGSNTNDGYQYQVKYPTELRIEKFSPPYLDPSLAHLRPEIVLEKSDQMTLYGNKLSVQVKSSEPTFNKNDVRLSMYAPPFTTHGISMNQRLVILGLVEVINNVGPGQHKIVAEAPPTGAVAPPGYYLFYVVYRGVPSVAMWFQIK